MLKRNIAITAICCFALALYLWFAPGVRPPMCYVADAAVGIAALAGLIWANFKGFRGPRFHWLGFFGRLITVPVLFILIAIAVVMYGWRIEPKIGAFLSPVAVNKTPAADFFPPFTFGSNADCNAFVLNWYTTQLKALGENSFYSLAADTNAHAFRFTCLRSFHNPFCVVIRFDHNGRATITGKIASGAGGYAPGRLCRVKQSTLHEGSSTEVLDLVDRTDFWNLPARVETFGCDGSQWIVEGVDHGNYHLVDRWTPDASTPVGRIGREMLALSGLRIWFLY